LESANNFYLNRKFKFHEISLANLKLFDVQSGTARNRVVEQAVPYSNNALKDRDTQQSMDVKFVSTNTHYDQTTVSAREIQNLLLNCTRVTRNQFFYVIGRGLEFYSRAELPKM
jgi:hypothetical protein